MENLESLQSLTPENLAEYAEETDLPALKQILLFVAKKNVSNDSWINEYCDYSDCMLAW